MVYASLKIFLNIVWGRLEPKDLTITAVGTKTNKFVPLCTPGCYVQVMSNSVKKQFMNWKRDSLCSWKAVVDWGENSFICFQLGLTSELKSIESAV